MKKRIVIGGSTGTIGTKTLAIIEEYHDEYSITGLIAHSRRDLFKLQLSHIQPKYFVFGEELSDAPDNGIQIGKEEISRIFEDCDLFINGISGLSGLEYSLYALKAGVKLALANKESLIVGHKLMKRADKDYLTKIIPVDSEHSALFQIHENLKKAEIDKVFITASGGILKNRPLRKEPSPEMILDHPNWDMGAVITVDSSTMVNKAYEVMEAHILFELPLSRIEVLFHPQSAVHGMVRTIDGNVLMHYSPTDMAFPIRYALNFPDREKIEKEYKFHRTLEFQPVNYDLYPNFHLFISTLKKGGRRGPALIYSNQCAVNLFLQKKIQFSRIFELNNYVAERFIDDDEFELNDLIRIRQSVDSIISDYLGGKL
ncbi:hypothetical protein KAU32_05810 [bacterium]|nr:hypothetical protein [bacterium]